MNVLSLFDGMSCGQIALQRANIDYCNYFASEINKQSISITQRNFPNDERSKLYFDFIRILKEVQPTWFLLENVKMKTEFSDIITEHLGVNPILINSRLVSAQDRKRLYWTNIKGVEQPKDKNISFQDIAPGWFCGCMRGRRVLNNRRCDYNKNVPIEQYIENRKDNKTNCLTTVTKDNVAVRTKQRFIKITEIEYRYLTPNEYELL